MQSVAAVCLLLATVGSLHAAPAAFSTAPQPCCMPDQLEFSVGESIGYTVHETSGLTQLAGHGAIDYKKKMLAFKEVGSSGGKPFNMTVIEDFTAQLMYLIDEDQQTCLKSKLPSSEMTAQCLPDDAKYMGTQTFGLGTTISGDAWYFHFKDEASHTDLNVFMVMQATSSDKTTCVPINEGVTGRTGEMGLFVGVSYYDLKDSISDPSIFNIPDFCKKEGVPLLATLPGSAFQNFLTKKHQKL